LPEVDWLPGEKRRQWVYYRLWPNLALDIYPDQVDFMQFIPISPGKTMIREIAYAIPDERREMKAARYLNWRVNRQVNAEDSELIARVQQGMGSSSFTSGPFAEREILLIDSAERIRRIIPAARQENEPPAGWR
jgi:phenylpropionate dioxygenase-like ring-hydroxylating dioxygenase large terminal subunit